MVTHAFAGRWAVRLATLVLWALAGAVVLFWALARPGQLPGLAPLATGQGPAIDVAAVARLLGAGAAARPAAVATAAAQAAPVSRFVLQGVLAGKASGGGAALIAIDGQPAKPFRVGAALEPGLVVQSLSRREVHLGPAPGAASSLTLQMPRLP